MVSFCSSSIYDYNIPYFDGSANSDQICNTLTYKGHVIQFNVSVGVGRAVID